MNQVVVFSTFSIIGILVSLLLAVFLLTVKTKHKLSNILFSIFLLVIAIDFAGMFSGRIYNWYPPMEVFRQQIACLLMPAFYLYIRSVCFSDFKLQAKHLLHLLPFLTANLLLTPTFYLADTAARDYYFSHYNSMTVNAVLRLILYCQSVFYIIAAFLTLKHFKNIYQQNYTASHTLIYKWLLQVTILLSIVVGISGLKVTFMYTQLTPLINWTFILLLTLIIALLCWFVLKALYHPELFRGVDSRLPLVKTILQTAIPAPASSASITTTPDHQTEKIRTLKAYMTAQEPYLDPELTVQELARQLRIPARDLSVLINHHLDQHFFDFVNEYRIQKAMQLLKDASKKERNIQEILYEVGFNSKSSFNTAFKKRTQLTPTQYRNTHYK